MALPGAQNLKTWNRPPAVLPTCPSVCGSKPALQDLLVVPAGQEPGGAPCPALRGQVGQSHVPRPWPPPQMLKRRLLSLDPHPGGPHPTAPPCPSPRASASPPGGDK